jgi:hypothetical protein
MLWSLLPAVAPGARLAYTELLDALQFGHRNKNPTADADSLDAASFDVPAKAERADVSQACA